MATPLDLTFDLVPPRRPGISDVGGAQKEDDLNYPPDPVRMLTGADENQGEKLTVAYGKVVANAKVTVHFSGSTPSVAQASGCGSAVVPSLFTVTDNGAGDTTISWPAGTFPAAIADHTARLTGATVGMIACETVSNGARVRTKDGTNTAADLAFVLEVN